MKMIYAATAVAVTIACASVAEAMPGDQPGDAAFCNNYAFSTKQYVDGVLARKPSCLDYSKGVHNNYQMHFDWCRRTSRGEVEGAAQNIRRLGNQCLGAGQRGGNFGGGNGGRGNFGGNRGGGNRGGGPTDPAFCQSYAQGMVALGAEAVRRNCLQYGAQGLHTNYQSHYNWCLGQTRSSATGAATHVNRLLASCNR